MPVFNYYAGPNESDESDLYDGSDVLYFRDYNWENINPTELDQLITAKISPVEKMFLKLIKNNLHYIKEYSYSDAHKYYCKIELKNGKIAEYTLHRCPAKDKNKYPTLTAESIEKDFSRLVCDDPFNLCSEFEP